MIERKEYLKQLLSWKDQSIIKVLTGIRRCGKSTILKLYQEYLLNNGIDPSQIISINFEELEYEDLQDYKKLYQYIKDRLVENKMMYIFLDEIQNVPSYEKVVDSLHVKENIDIYITGSNSYIFSGQLATYLSGRYIEIPVLPLSFKEVYNPQTNKEEAFQKYIKTGGFPYIHQIQLLNEQIDMYLEGIYNTVIVKDIEERINRKNSKSVTDIALLKAISKYLSSVVGSPVSIRSITNYFKSNERTTSPNTISNYVEALCESYLYYPVEVMDVSGKEVLKSNKKYYIVDPGIRNYILPKQFYDLGFTIENIVYLELLRRRYNVNIGRNGRTEVDFIAKRNDVYTYIQVTASLVDENTFNREIRPLKQIKDNYEKIILTLDRYTLGNYEGIKVINIIDWLLEE
ncbi:MAG: ATP-binding protein [Catenibacterium mitsuokai]|uniref:ATP-binding protein n=2 Tax=Catenibacterium TaxID=135858 RepID=UPI00242B68D2|nr:ATP-binding protein [Catenibacterium mitsuokai]MDY3675827.1 ATP-binding protein [Catenibacterium mitsuokai]